MAYYPNYSNYQVPYQNQFQNPYMGYQQQLQPNYMQQSVNQNQIPQNNQIQLPGQMVDSLDAAKAKDVDMSGTPRFYPNINLQEIYMKQLQPDGTCPTIVYRRVLEEPVRTSDSLPADMLKQVLAEVEAIKLMVSDTKQTGTKSGGAKT